MYKVHLGNLEESNLVVSDSSFLWTGVEEGVGEP
jgi:hypothetical protein